MKLCQTLFVVIGVVALSGCGGSGPGPLGVGAAPPKLLAEGWLNGTSPGEAELVGKVVVVEVWAHW
jgi:hypothetical protein